MGKILVVDDDQGICDLFKRICGTRGHDVVAVQTGEECINYLNNGNSNEVNLIFLDLQMPGMSGEKTLEEIRKLNGTLPVAVITGYWSLHGWFRLNDKHVIGYIQKPFNIHHVIDLADRIIASYKYGKHFL